MCVLLGWLFNLNISRHTVVCSAAQESGVCANGLNQKQSNLSIAIRDVLSKWHQIHSAVSLHQGEATFQI